MRYQLTIRGTSPIIMHNGAAGLDTRSPANLEKAGIAKKRGSNRTEADDLRLRELETQTAFWLNSAGTPEVPAAALRAASKQEPEKSSKVPRSEKGS